MTEPIKLPTELERLASLWDDYLPAYDYSAVAKDTAAELRRLHSENERLSEVVTQALEPVAWMVYAQDGQSVYVTDNPIEIGDAHKALPLYTSSLSVDLRAEVERLREMAGKWESLFQAQARLSEVAQERADKAKAEVERLRADYGNACKTVAQMHAAATGRPGEGPRLGVVEDMAAVHAEVEALRAAVLLGGIKEGELRVDAERYRWLRECARATSEHWGGRWSLVTEGPAPRNATPAGIDAAIDAARAALKEPK